MIKYLYDCEYKGIKGSLIVIEEDSFYMFLNNDAGGPTRHGFSGILKVSYKYFKTLSRYEVAAETIII